MKQYNKSIYILFILVILVILIGLLALHLHIPLNIFYNSNKNNITNLYIKSSNFTYSNDSKQKIIFTDKEYKYDNKYHVIQYNDKTSYLKKVSNYSNIMNYTNLYKIHYINNQIDESILIPRLKRAILERGCSLILINFEISQKARNKAKLYFSLSNIKINNVFFSYLSIFILFSIIIFFCLNTKNKRIKYIVMLFFASIIYLRIFFYYNYFSLNIIWFFIFILYSIIISNLLLNHDYILSTLHVLLFQIIINTINITSDFFYILFSQQFVILFYFFPILVFLIYHLLIAKKINLFEISILLFLLLLTILFLKIPFTNNFHIEIRNSLQKLFFIRPRTKDIVFFLLFLLLKSKGNLLPKVMLMLFFSNILNSSYHIHTPIIITLYRTLLSIFISYLIFLPLSLLKPKKIKTFIISYPGNNFGDNLLKANVSDYLINSKIISQNDKIFFSKKSFRILNDIINIFKSKKIILLGGLLQDKSSFKSLFYYTYLISIAKFLNIKIYSICTTFGPINKTFSKFFLKFTLPNLDFIEFRDYKSKKHFNYYSKSNQQFIKKDIIDNSNQVFISNFNNMKKIRDITKSIYKNKKYILYFFPSQNGNIDNLKIFITKINSFIKNNVINVSIKILYTDDLSKKCNINKIYKFKFPNIKINKIEEEYICDFNSIKPYFYKSNSIYLVERLHINIVLNNNKVKNVFYAGYKSNNYFKYL